MDEREAETKKEDRMWGNGEREGELTRGEGKKVSVDVHEKSTGVDSVRVKNDERAKYGRVYVDKNEKRRENIFM